MRLKCVLVIQCCSCALLGSVSVSGSVPDRLVLISPHPDEVQTEFEQAFREQYHAQTGNRVSLEWLDVGGTSAIIRYIRSEFGRKGRGIGIDVFFGGGLDPYLKLADLGLLLPTRLPQETLDRLPESLGGIALFDRDYRWYGATLAGFGIAYNRKVLELLDLPAPVSWADLGDPRLFSWVGSGDPRTSGSVHMAYELILQGYGWDRGWEIITGLGGNVRRFGSGGSQAPKEVAVGEVAYGLSIDFYAWAQMDKVGEGYIGFVIPENLSIVNPDGIGILKGAPNRAVAEAFVRFVMSEAGQKLWFLKKGAPGGPRLTQLNRFTILPDLYEDMKSEAAVKLNPFDWSSDLKYDSEKVSGRWGVLNDLIGVLIIDSHEALKRAWKRAASDGSSRSDLERLFAVPVTESECLEMGRRWRDPAFRNRMLAEWTAFAREKYGSRDERIYVQLGNLLTLLLPLGLAGATVCYLWSLRRP